MTTYSSLLLFVFLFIGNGVFAQSESIDSIQYYIEFTSLEEALKNPEEVYRLNLSNQYIELPDNVLSKFTNLKYLSLKNDHLKEIPESIGDLTNLQVLDLSGNDFKVLPPTFIKLTNLQELFLNDETHFRLERNISILSSLPNLKSLHIENDRLRSLPKGIFKLSVLESLYLNNNKFKNVPAELNGLVNLKYVDFQGNQLVMPNVDVQEHNVGFRIKF